MSGRNSNFYGGRISHVYLLFSPSFSKNEIIYYSNRLQGMSKLINKHDLPGYQ